MALSRSMKNLMHEAANKRRGDPDGKITPKAPGRRLRGVGGMLQQGIEAGQRANPSRTPGRARGLGGMIAQAAERSQAASRPGSGTFGFANRRGTRGAFERPEAGPGYGRRYAQAKADADRRGQQVSGRQGPTRGHRGGGMPRAFGSRAYLR